MFLYLFNESWYAIKGEGQKLEAKQMLNNCDDKIAKNANNISNS